jgi:2-C-methyl-D-erythritol 2,4-cyclodiphosphate synthase
MGRSVQPDTRLRIGQGFDAHAFADGRPLVLGGVRIDHPRGLAGHSDGDALLHAIADALLGAAGLGDLGQRFPSDDPRYRGADSRDLLRAVAAALRDDGWHVINVDATVIAQTPRLAPYVEQMRQQIAAVLAISPDAVSVKPKTPDHLGALGRQEGIAALAVALLRK